MIKYFPLSAVFLFSLFLASYYYLVRNCVLLLLVSFVLSFVSQAFTVIIVIIFLSGFHFGAVFCVVIIVSLFLSFLLLLVFVVVAALLFIWPIITKHS